MLFRTFKRIAVILSAMILMMACSDKSTEPEQDDQQPVPPPSTTMTMAFDDFDMTPGSQLHKTADAQYGNNWLQGATLVNNWEVLTAAYLAIPQAAFDLAHSQQPEFQDGQWVWSYDISAGQVSFNITFKAGLQVRQNQWYWAMYFSQQNLYEDFMWFDGFSATDGSEGGWTFYDYQQNQAAVLQIDWNFADDDTVPTVRFTNVDTNDTAYGSYIEFGPLSDANYNAYFTIYDATNKNTIQIQWHRQNKNGRIQDPAYFDDNDWHCWDSSYNDVACPQ